MKNIVFGILIVVIQAFVSCSLENKADYLPPFKVDIPDALKNNTDAVNFIDESTDVLNKWSITFEDLVVECEPFIGKQESELSTMDKLMLGKTMMEFVANMGQFAVKVADMEQTASMINDGLSEQEMEAMAIVMEAFDNRIVELNEKYQDFGKKDK